MDPAVPESWIVGNPEVILRLIACGVLWSREHKIGERGIPMLYKRISVEVIVVADEAEAVVAELNVALDRLEESHTLFGGGIETVAFEHPGKRRRSALAHTIAAGETVVGALKTARDDLVNMPIQCRHRAKRLQHCERLLAVLGTPAPLFIDHPQRIMREDHDGCRMTPIRLDST